MRSERDRLTAEVAKLKTDKAALSAKLEEARRANKRQAAPFSRDRRTPEHQRRRPGRKPGADHGAHNHRRAPTRPDEEVEVGLPGACPHCGGDNLVVDRWATQHQDELVTAIRRRRYRIACGHCPDCDRPLRARHPDQTSDASGAAGCMLGPKAVALAAWLRHGCGLPAAKIARLYANLGLSVSASGLTRAIQNLADDASGTYDALIATLRRSAVVSPDETGWRIDGERAWLWVFVGDKVTVYSIAIGEGARGFESAEEILGADYDGVICRDGWSVYRSFTKATHQTCLAHLARRAREMLADSVAGQARVPHAVLGLIGDALVLRTKRDTAQIAGDALEAAIVALEARADALLSSRATYEPNVRLLRHLGTERDALLTFLRRPGLPATNHEAERGLRPKVTERKNWGGNKSLAGARASVVTSSVIRTATQQDRDPITVLMAIATSDGAFSGLDLPSGADP